MLKYGFFPQQRKLGVFSHSRGSGAGRSSQIRTAQGWEPGFGEGSPFLRESLGAAKSARHKIGNRVPRKRFPSKVPRSMFPSKVSKRFPGTGSQARVPSKRFPSKVPRKRFPSKVPKQGSQEEVTRFQGFQATFPKQDFQEHVFPKRNKVPRTGFQASVSRKRFPGRGVQARFPASWFPSNVFRKRFPSKGFHEEFSKQGFQAEVLTQRFAGTG